MRDININLLRKHSCEKDIQNKKEEIDRIEIIIRNYDSE